MASRRWSRRKDRVRSYIQKHEEEDKRLDELYNTSRPHQRSITERTALLSGLSAAAASCAVDFLIYDLQFRLRCSHCNARVGFRITIFDTRTRGDNSKPRLERVVVAGE